MCSVGSVAEAEAREAVRLLSEAEIALSEALGHVRTVQSAVVAVVAGASVETSCGASLDSEFGSLSHAVATIRWVLRMDWNGAVSETPASVIQTRAVAACRRADLASSGGTLQGAARAVSRLVSGRAGRGWLGAAADLLALAGRLMQAVAAPLRVLLRMMRLVWVRNDQRGGTVDTLEGQVASHTHLKVRTPQEEAVQWAALVFRLVVATLGAEAQALLGGVGGTVSSVARWVPVVVRAVGKLLGLLGSVAAPITAALRPALAVFLQLVETMGVAVGVLASGAATGAVGALGPLGDAAVAVASALGRAWRSTVSAVGAQPGTWMARVAWLWRATCGVVAKAWALTVGQLLGLKLHLSWEPLQTQADLVSRVWASAWAAWAQSRVVATVVQGAAEACRGVPGQLWRAYTSARDYFWPVMQCIDQSYAASG